MSDSSINSEDKKIKTDDNILEYFDRYIKTFAPYKDNNVYRAFVDFIIKYLVNEIYSVQPSEFKQLFEEQDIPSNVVDRLLVALGLPSELILTLTTNTKLLILQAFSDFQRYKGTVKFIRKIGGSLSDRISYYELYIDYDSDYINSVGKYILVFQKNDVSNNSYFTIDSIDRSYYVWFNFDDKGKDPALKDKIGIEIKIDSRDTNKSIARRIITELNLTNELYAKINTQDIIEISLSKSGYSKGLDRGTTNLKFSVIDPAIKNGAWIMRAKPIYIHPEMTQRDTVFKYKEVYDKIPNLLISEEHLTNLYENSDIVLPIKSNILLLDYNNDIRSSQMNTLLFTIIMSRIADDFLDVYLSGESTSTSTTYKNIVFFWYYLLQLYFNVPLSSSMESVERIILGSVYGSELSVEDIPIIVNEYNQIKTKEELYNFVSKYYTSQYLGITSKEETTLDGVADTAKRLDPELYDYIENRLRNSEDVNSEIAAILDELYASIKISFQNYKDDPILSKYIDIILENLVLVSTDIKNTDSYKLVTSLKPYHTEIFDISTDSVTINNKFDALMMEVFFACRMEFAEFSAESISDQFGIKIPFIDHQDSLSLITAFNKLTIGFGDDKAEQYDGLNDKLVNKFKMFRTDSYGTIDDSKFIVKKYIKPAGWSRKYSQDYGIVNDKGWIIV